MLGQVQQCFSCSIGIKHGTAIERAVDGFALPERRIYRTQGKSAYPYASGALFDGKTSAELDEGCLANAVSTPVREGLVGCMAVHIDDVPAASSPQSRQQRLAHLKYSSEIKLH